MKYFLALVFLLIGFVAQAANPSFSDFQVPNFITSGNVVKIPTNTVVVSPRGIANGLAATANAGKPFGPDTPGTTTSGIQEARNYLFQNTVYGPQSGGGTVQLMEGTYYCSGQLFLSNNTPYNLTIKGAGKFNTVVVYTNATVKDFVITTRTTNGLGTLNLKLEDTCWAYGNSTNKTALFALDFLNELTADNCLFCSYQMLFFPGGNSSAVVYFDSYPTNKQGLVGFHITNANNKVTFTKCAFYGMAGHVFFEAGSDHNEFYSCFFGEAGIHYAPGDGTPIAETAYTVGTRYNTFLSAGPSVVTAGSDTSFYNCQWTRNTICVLSTASETYIENPIFEAATYNVLEEGPSQGGATVIHSANQVTPTDGVINASTGVITANGEVGGITDFLMGSPASGFPFLRINSRGVDRFKIDTYGNTTIAGSLVVATNLTANGANLTNLSASALESGTISSDRFPNPLIANELTAGGTFITFDGDNWVLDSGKFSASGFIASDDGVFATQIILTNAPTFNTTNAAPANVTVGVTAPDCWFVWTNSGGTRLFSPGWRAH